MDKARVFKKFWSLVSSPMNVRSLNELVERKPTEEELELIDIMLKLPPEKQELWFTAFTTIWEYESDIIKTKVKKNGINLTGSISVISNG